MVIDKDNTDDPWLYWHFHTIIDSHRGRSVLPGARIAAHEKKREVGVTSAHDRKWEVLGINMAATISDVNFADPFFSKN